MTGHCYCTTVSLPQHCGTLLFLQVGVTKWHGNFLKAWPSGYPHLLRKVGDWLEYHSTGSSTLTWMGIWPKTYLNIFPLTLTLTLTIILTLKNKNVFRKMKWHHFSGSCSDTLSTSWWWWWTLLLNFCQGMERAEKFLKDSCSKLVQHTVACKSWIFLCSKKLQMIQRQRC